MNRKRVAAILGLAGIILLFAALIFILLFEQHQKAEKTMAVLFAIFFISITAYAMNMIIRLLKDKKNNSGNSGDSK